MLSSNSTSSDVMSPSSTGKLRSLLLEASSTRRRSSRAMAGGSRVSKLSLTYKAVRCFHRNKSSLKKRILPETQSDAVQLSNVETSEVHPPVSSNALHSVSSPSATCAAVRMVCLRRLLGEDTRPFRGLASPAFTYFIIVELVI